MPNPVGFPSLPVQSRVDPLYIRQIVETSNRVNAGKINVTTEITLTANAATTTLTDARLSAQSYIDLSPLTSNAAAALGGVYYTNKVKGSATINHANNAQTDRTFTVLIIG